MSKPSYLHIKILVLLLAFTVAIWSKSNVQGKTSDDKNLSITLPSDSLVGVWKVSQSITYTNPDGTQVMVLQLPEIFRYDGKYVTTMYMDIWEQDTVPPWRSKDYIYKLKCKWKGDTLYYLNPFKEWELLAVYQNGIFTVEILANDSTYLSEFHKIAPDSLKEYDKSILKPRKLFDYSN